MRSRTSLRVAGVLACAAFLLTTPARGDDDVPRAVLTAPVLVTPANPDFPEEARASGLRHGAVRLVLTVDRDGHVESAVVDTSGGEPFDRAALDVARTLVFRPATKDGVAVPARIGFRIAFEDVVEEPPPEPPPPPPAPPPPPSEPPTEVRVRGEAAPREPTRRTLTRTEIRSMPGANGDPLRAVENLPGVARAPAPGGALVLRGAAPDETHVLVEGSWIPVAYHFGGIATVVPEAVVESIDVRPGNFGPEYGRAAGGIVGIGLRSPRRDRFGGMAQVDLLDGRLLVEGPLSERTRLLVAARRSWVDAWIGGVLEGGGTGVRTAPRYADAQALLEHDLTPDTRLRLTLLGSDDRLALFVSSPGAQDPSGGSLASRTTFTRVIASSKSRLAEGLRFSTMASWGINADRLAFGGNTVDTTLHMAQARAELEARLARRVSATMGVEALYTHFDLAFLVPPSVVLADEAPGSLFAQPRRRLSTTGQAVRPAPYAQLALRPVDGLTILPGARLDASSETGRATVDPRISARWDVVPGDRRVTAKGGLGVHRQQTSLETLPPFGDERVRWARSVHASTGLEHRLADGVEASVEGFMKWYDGIPVARGDAQSTAGFVFENTGDGRARGVELSVRAAPVGSRFSGSLAYTLSRSERRDRPAEPRYLFGFDQTHVLAVTGAVNLGRGFTLGARFRYVTGTPYTPYVGGLVDLDAGAYQPLSGPRNGARLPDFHRLDARLEKTWTVGTAAKLSAYLDVQNVTNSSNPEARVYRYDYARSANASGLPILPVLGLRGEL